MQAKKSYSFEYTVYTSLNQLSINDQKLLYAAVEVSKDAYAPYSNFYVGASVELENGVTVLGSNQENGAYPSGLCAERVALFAASSNFPNVSMKTLAIYAEQSETEDNQISPCGSCRQVMSEYEQKQNQKLRVLLMSGKGEVWELKSAQFFLPFAFKLKPSKK
ncbi:MAG: cytidine deaminase [Vicingaceae bacterium]